MAPHMDWANVSPFRWLNCAFISHHATHRGYDVIDLIAAATSLPTYKSDIYFSLGNKLRRVRHESIDLWKLYNVVIFYAAFWFNFFFNVKFRFYWASSLTISFTAVLYLSSVLHHCDRPEFSMRDGLHHISLYTGRVCGIWSVAYV